MNFPRGLKVSAMAAASLAAACASNDLRPVPVDNTSDLSRSAGIPGIPSARFAVNTVNLEIDPTFGYIVYANSETGPDGIKTLYEPPLDVCEAAIDGNRRFSQTLAANGLRGFWGIVASVPGGGESSRENGTLRRAENIARDVGESVSGFGGRRLENIPDYLDPQVEQDFWERQCIEAHDLDPLIFSPGMREEIQRNEIDRARHQRDLRRIEGASSRPSFSLSGTGTARMQPGVYPRDICVNYTGGNTPLNETFGRITGIFTPNTSAITSGGSRGCTVREREDALAARRGEYRPN